MNVPREQLSLALFSQIQTCLNANPNLKGQIRGYTRVCRMWTEVGENEKPLVLLFKGGPKTEEYEQPEDRRLALTRYTIAYNLWLYVSVNATANVTPEPFLNNFADGLDQAMTTRISNGILIPAAGERQTLGGLVNNAWLAEGSEWAREFQDGNLVCMWKIYAQTGM